MKDILLNDSGDVSIINGDFDFGDSFLQNQKRIILDNKNDWKQNPQMGVGIEMFLEDESPDALFREVREQLLKDGQTVTSLGFNTDGQIEIEAK